VAVCEAGVPGVLHGRDGEVGFSMGLKVDQERWMVDWPLGELYGLKLCGC
jgi:hypothetical protein